MAPELILLASLPLLVIIGVYGSLRFRRARRRALERSHRPIHVPVSGTKPRA